VKGVFVTGTDTDVGKTVVTAALAMGLKMRGVAVCVVKPVQTGEGDAATLKRLACLDSSLEEIAPFSFDAPLAPLVAARLQGVELDLDDVVSRVPVGDDACAIVEGAGGLLCPVGPDWTIADLAKQLSLPVLVVARAGLGTVNHTLLTVREATRRGLDVAGVVLNGAGDESTATNAEMIEWFGGVRVLARIPWFTGGPTSQDLAELDLDLALKKDEAHV
jgi:dethiobiotin synthetase